MAELILNELNSRIGHIYPLARPLCYMTALVWSFVFMICCTSLMNGLNSFFVRILGMIVFVFILCQICTESILVDDCNRAFHNYRLREKVSVISKYHAMRFKSFRKVQVQNGWICFSLNRAFSANLIKSCFDGSIVILLLVC